MDPRYTDFSEVELSALHPTIQKRREIRVEPDLFWIGQQSKALEIAWLGGRAA